MAITILKGANALSHGHQLRAAAISAKRGCLFINEASDGDIAPMLEKIIFGVPFVPGTAIEDIPWKDDPLIVVTEGKAARLKAIEKALPGFTAKFGPVETVTA